MSALAASILVTGASRGLGFELVRQLVLTSPAPDLLVAACRNPDQAVALQELARGHDCVKVIQMDVEDDDSIDAAVKETQALVGEQGLNLLINNVGIYLHKKDRGEVRVQTRERMQRHFNVNTTSGIIVTQKFLPLLEMAAARHEHDALGCRKAAIVFMSGMMGSQAMSRDAKPDILRSLDLK